MHLGCRKECQIYLKHHRKFVYPYLGKNIEKCRGIECVRSRRMAVLEGKHVHISVAIVSLLAQKLTIFL